LNLGSEENNRDRSISAIEKSVSDKVEETWYLQTHHWQFIILIIWLMRKKELSSASLFSLCEWTQNSEDLLDKNCSIFVQKEE
jgi:hypothetical protein